MSAKPVSARQQKSRSPYYRALLIGTVFSLSVLGNAAQGADDEARLRQLRSDIERLNSAIQKNQADKHTAESQLQLTEMRIGKLLAAIRQLDKKLAAQDQHLVELNSSQQQIVHQLKSHQRDLAQQLRAAYVMGQQPYLRLLLNLRDPAQVSRSLGYYKYIHTARLQQIDTTQSALREIQTLQREIESQQQTLQSTREQRLKDQQQLDQDRQQRQHVVAGLSTQITDQRGQLTRLEEDEKRLLGLLTDLQANPVSLDIPELKQRPFKSLKGQLPWPTIGSMLARYGTPRPGNALKWQGLLIGTQQGAAVHAVAHGQVIFADWLRGFGLLIIIDHGEGYMSLYAQNESLYKETGDWVSGNDVIASVGNSGAARQDGLYFEIRQRGKPNNPLIWLQRKP